MDSSGDLVHHSDRGTQYLSMRYTERLGEAGIAPSVGSRGDSYDNAVMESWFSTVKSEEGERFESYPSTCSRSISFNSP
jgi:transposase InsO family protein